MNREAEEFRISSDIKQANLEAVQARLEKAESLLKDISETLRSDRKIESANFIDEFLASKQVEHLEGFTHFPELLESVQQMDAMLKAEGAQGELKPCPFCGEPAEERADEPYGRGWFACSNNECPCWHLQAEAHDWNARAALAQPSQAPELERPEVEDE